MNLVLKSLQKPVASPIAPLIALALAELALSGFGDTFFAPDWDGNAFYAEVNGVPVGFLCWKKSEYLQEAQISLGYVFPAYRGQGIYSRLFAALEAEAIKLGLRSISSGTHVNNTTMQAVALRQGRELISLGYRKKLLFDGDIVPGPETQAQMDDKE